MNDAARGNGDGAEATVALPGGEERVALETVYEALRDVVNRHSARLMPVLGSPGSGRSTFVDRAAAFLSESREHLIVYTVRLRTLPPHPEAALAAIVRARFGLAEGPTGAEDERRIREVLGSLLPDERVARAARDLAALAHAADADGAAAVPERALGTFRNLLRHDASRREHLLVLDDIDRAPPGLGPLLRDTIERLRDVPVLVLATAEDDRAEDDRAEDDRAEDDRAEDDRAEDDRAAKERFASLVSRPGLLLAPLILPPWTGPRLERLLARRLEEVVGAPVELAPAHVAEALAVAAGRPGRLASLVDAAQEVGLLRAGGARGVLPVARAGWGRAVRRLWAAEVESLSEAGRGLLARAAVLGERFPQDLLVTVVAGAAPGDVLAAWSAEGLRGDAAEPLGCVERAGLLVPTPAGATPDGAGDAAFAHPSLRTAAAAGLRDGDREAAHAAAARWWSAHADRPADHVRAAVHASAAGLDALAAAAWERAADDPAAPLGERAARAERGLALATAGDGGAEARLAIRSAAARLARVELAEAEAAARHALQAAWPARHRDLAARAHALLADVALLRGDVAGALQLAARGVGLSPDVFALCAAAAATRVRGAAGAVAEATAAAAGAWTAAAGGPPAERLAAELATAEVALAADERAETDRALAAAADLLAEHGDPALLAVAALLQAERALARGEAEDALAHAAAGVAAAERVGDRLALFRLTGIRAVSAAALGAPEDGAAEAAEGDAVAMGAAFPAVELRLARARAALLRGEDDAARAHAAVAAAGADRIGAGTLAARARAVEAVARRRAAGSADSTAADALAAESMRKLAAAGEALALHLGPDGVREEEPEPGRDEDTATYPLPFPPGDELS